jgi:hypothetical protein
MMDRDRGVPASDRGPHVVFLGPSLAAAQAREVHPEVVVLPPAAMGDVLGVLVTMRPHAIGIVDGSFRHTMAVFHKEILYAMEHGAWVLGAGSLGALRAAECDRYGMIGVGEIYQALARGDLVDDDEVALVHASGDHGHAAVSSAMVTIRATLAAMVAVGLIDDRLREALCERQKQRWFPDRVLARVAVDAAELGASEDQVAAIAAFCRDHVVDPKRTDAIALLERMRDLPDGPMLHAGPTVISGPFSGQLSRDVRVRSVEGHVVTFDRIRRYATLHDPDHERTLALARVQVAMDALFAYAFGEPSPEEIALGEEGLAQALGTTREELIAVGNAWDLDTAGVHRLARSRALQARAERSQVARYWGPAITQAYLDQARLSGRYAELKQAAALHWAAAQTVAIPPGVATAQVISAIEAIRGERFPRPLTSFVQEEDLGSVQELLLTVTDSLQAYQALFGLSFDAFAAEESPEMGVDLGEPMMSRVTGI